MLKNTVIGSKNGVCMKFLLTTNVYYFLLNQRLFLFGFSVFRSYSFTYKKNIL